MPIRWSAVAVSESMDKVEAEIENIFEPLWRAHTIVKETAHLPNLPDYMVSRLSSLESEILNITGVDLQRHGSRVLAKVAGVRDDLPEGSVEAEKNATKHGKTHSLFS